MNGVKRNMKSNEIKQYTPLLIELLKRDIKVKYRKSVLGVLWSVLNPLFMMIILSVVFSTLFKNNVENYPTYIFSGQLIYNFFSEATTSSMSAIPDILIVDEVLSVGDFRFQKKCEDRIKKMQESGTTVLFVSHSIEQVKKICNKIVWLDHGKVRMYGNTREVCEEYEKI